MDAKEKKQCNNCKNFVLYYTIDRSILLKLHRGHCRKSKTYRSLMSDHCCELWEDKTSDNEERRSSVDRNLERIAKSLNALSLILQADDD